MLPLLPFAAPRAVTGRSKTKSWAEGARGQWCWLRDSWPGKWRFKATPWKGTVGLVWFSIRPAWYGLPPSAFQTVMSSPLCTHVHAHAHTHHSLGGPCPDSETPHPVQLNRGHRLLLTPQARRDPWPGGWQGSTRISLSEMTATGHTRIKRNLPESP